VAEKEYIIPYSEEVRKRHYHKTTRGKVVKFMVQLETRMGDVATKLRYSTSEVRRLSYKIWIRPAKIQSNINFFMIIFFNGRATKD